MKLLNFLWALSVAFLFGIIAWMVVLYFNPASLRMSFALPSNYQAHLAEAQAMPAQNGDQDSVSPDTEMPERRTLRQEARELALQGFSADAIILIEQSINLGDPKSAPILVDLGTYYESQGRHVEAYASYQNAVVLNSEYSRAYFRIGELSAKDKRYDEALRYLGLAIKYQPHYVEAHYSLAQVHQALKNSFEAIEAYKSVTRMDNGALSANAFSNIGKIHETMRDPNKALSDYSSALERDPTHTRARFKLASLLNDLDLKLQSSREYQKLLLNEPEHFAALTNRAIILKKLGQQEEALMLLEAAADIKPSNPKIWYNLGIFNRDFGNLDLAIQNFRRAITLDPDYALAHEKLGDCLAKRGNSQQALASYHEAIKAEPDDQGIEKKIADAYYKRDEYDQALPRYQDLVDQSPKDTISLYRLGKCYYEIGKYPRSAEVLSTLTRKSPRHYLGHFYQGLSYLKLDQFTQAEKAFKEAGRWEESEILSYNLGLTYESQNKIKLAIDSYKKALEIKPNHESSLEHFGELCLKEGRISEAESALKKLQELSPSSPRIYNLGIRSYRSKNLDVAETLFSLAASGSPMQRDKSRYMLAKIAIQQKDRVGAISILKSILSETPNYTKARKLLAESYAQEREHSRAAYHYGQLLVSTPQDADYHYALGVQYEAMKQPDKAKSHFQEALAADPNHAKALQKVAP